MNQIEKFDTDRGNTNCKFDGKKTHMTKIDQDRLFYAILIICCDAISREHAPVSRRIRRLQRIDFTSSHNIERRPKKVSEEWK
jgi:hypothetical protein